MAQVLVYTAKMLYNKINQRHCFVRGFTGSAKYLQRGVRDKYARWEVPTHQLAHRAAESVCNSYDLYASGMLQLDARTLAKSNHDIQ